MARIFFRHRSLLKMQLISFLCVVVATFSLTECLPVDGKMRGASQLCHSIAQSYKDQVICEKFFMEDTKVAGEIRQLLKLCET